MEVTDLQVGDYAFITFDVEHGAWIVIDTDSNLQDLRDKPAIKAAVEAQVLTWRFVQIVDPAPFRGE